MDPGIPDLELLEPLGRGSSGTVYLARRNDGSIVAAKRVEAGPSARNLTRWADRLMALRHPGMAAIEAVHVLENGDVLLLRTPVGSETLRSRLETEGTFSPEATRQLLTRLLETLSWAHDHGYVHGDLKPENVLLTDEGPVLVDVSPLPPADSDADRDGLVPSWTDPETVPGSLGYWAPERTPEARPTPAWDIYALGVMTFELLTGDRPSGPELPGDHHPNAPAWGDAFYRRACARVNHRFSDAGRAYAFLVSRTRSDPSVAPDRQGEELSGPWIAPVAPGATVWLPLETGPARHRIRGLTRPMAARLTWIEPGFLEVAGPAPIRKWERYLADLPEQIVVALPGPDGVWIGVADPMASDVATEPRPIHLTRSGIHRFDRLRVRDDGVALLYDRHDHLADVRTAARLRDLFDEGATLEDAARLTDDPALLAAWKLAENPEKLERAAERRARCFRAVPLEG